MVSVSSVNLTAKSRFSFMKSCCSSGDQLSKIAFSMAIRRWAVFFMSSSLFSEKNTGVPPGSGFQVQITGLFHPAYRGVDRGFCGAGLFVKDTLIAAGTVFIEGVENIKLAVRETEL